MRKRILSCLALGGLGLLAAGWLSENFNLSLTVARVAGGFIGAAIGYAASQLVDVMTHTAD
ncbi:MAG TPA: hypothetical protein VKV15_10495 [Bryobacteraceae bacterium]|nr:hypothetical protein [Bryobacteraceae bacterium]